jgi:methylthioribose-1-phosphate isomerase
MTTTGNATTPAAGGSVFGDPEDSAPPLGDSAHLATLHGAPPHSASAHGAPVLDAPVFDAPALDDSVRVEGGVVRILDRRVFPETVSWVTATDAEEVGAAIAGMVTQSSGPLFAAYAGLEMTALQVADLAPDAARERMREAGRVLESARPTNNHPREAVAHVLAAVDAAVDAAGAGDAGGAAGARTAVLVEAAVEAAREGAAIYRDRSRRLGESTVELLPDGARILTHCWMDTYLIEFVRAARAAGKRFEWVATETRPYLQGARLTAHTLAEFGERVTLITDGMGAAALAAGHDADSGLEPGARHTAGIGPIDALVTAADRVSLDGSVVNKVGTLGLAVAAHTFGVPFYALVQAPDAEAPTAADIVVESRDPGEVLHTLGRRTASSLVTEAWYPAFDVTPSRFVSRIVTDRGAFEPARVGELYAAAGERARRGQRA